MTMLDVILGQAVEIVGVEDAPGYQPGAGTRVFVGLRYEGRYFLVYGENAETAKRKWAATFTGHLMMRRDEVPPLLTEEEPCT